MVLYSSKGKSPPKAMVKAKAKKVAKTHLADERSCQEESLSSTRRRLARRDSEEKIDRVMKDTVYKKHKQEVVESIVLPDGMTPRKAVEEEYRRKSSTGEKFKPKCWK